MSMFTARPVYTPSPSSKETGEDKYKIKKAEDEARNLRWRGRASTLLTGPLGLSDNNLNTSSRTLLGN